MVYNTWKAVGLRLVVFLILVFLWTSGGWAQQQLPWETPLQGVATSLTGPVLRNAFIIAGAVGVIMWWANFSIVTTLISLLVGGAIGANLDAIAGLVGF